MPPKENEITIVIMESKMGLEICPVIKTMTCPHKNGDCDNKNLAVSCQHVKAHKASVETLSLIMQVSGHLSTEIDGLLRELKAGPRAVAG